MNLKRAKLLVTAFVAALVLFSVLLTVPLPAPASPRTPRAGQPSSARSPERRVDVTSLAREEPPIEIAPGVPPTDPAAGATSSAESDAPTTPVPATAEALIATGTKPPEAIPVDRQSVPEEIEDPLPATEREQPLDQEPTEPLELAEVSEKNTRIVDAPRLTPRVAPEPPPRPRDARRRTVSPTPRDDAETSQSERTLDDDLSALEKLLGTGDSLSAVAKKPSRNERPETELVTKLERLFARATPPRREIDAVSPTRNSGPEKPSGPTSLPLTAPRTVEEWQDRRHHLRALARGEDTDKVSAMFRLEQQDPETFRSVMAQYRMDVLLEVPSRGTYSIIPHDGDYWDRTEFRKGENDLRIRYGLSVRDLNLPWLGKLRETHVATQLVSTETVAVALLVPKHETEILLGSIVAGCRGLGHSLDEVSACYGTFVVRELSGKRLFDYEVTRLILRNGTLVEASGT